MLQREHTANRFGELSNRTQYETEEALNVRLHYSTRIQFMAIDGDNG